MLRTIILITRGILLDTRSRRWCMFYLLLGALFMIAAGSTFLAPDIKAPYRFLVYWCICGWLTFAALLLALWDMFLVRIAARQEQVKLQKRMLNKDDTPGDPPPHDLP
jgi:hypothetical protein